MGLQGTPPSGAYEEGRLGTPPVGAYEEGLQGTPLAGTEAGESPCGSQERRAQPYLEEQEG